MAIRVLDDGALRFLGPDGNALDSVAPGHTRPVPDLPALHREHDIGIDTRTAVTRWAGESMDYGLAVQVLLQKRRRREVSAET